MRSNLIGAHVIKSFGGVIPIFTNSFSTGDIIMKKLIKLSAASAVIIAAGAAFSTAQADDVHIIGDVNPFCELSIEPGFDEEMDFETPIAGDSLDLGWVYRCNDFDGATVRMTSTEGGLESDDNEDLEIEYVATLSLGGFSLALDTGVSTNVNDVEVEGDISGSNAPLVGNLNVTLSDTAPFAGGYSDTLQVDIEAN